MFVRSFSAVVVTLFASALGCGGGAAGYENTPEGVTRAFIKAIKAEDMDRLMSMTPEKSRKKHEQNRKKPGFARLGPSMVKAMYGGVLKELKSNPSLVLEESVGAEGGTVRVVFQHADGTEKEAEFKLVKEKGKWRVVGGYMKTW